VQNKNALLRHKYCTVYWKKFITRLVIKIRKNKKKLEFHNTQTEVSSRISPKYTGIHKILLICLMKRVLPHCWFKLVKPIFLTLATLSIFFCGSSDYQRWDCSYTVHRKLLNLNINPLVTRTTFFIKFCWGFQQSFHLVILEFHFFRFSKYWT
jgi:hypothetical protein